jgi:hypothetical protein
MTDRAPFEALDAYQSRGMPDADAEGFEEELFAAAAAGTATEAAFVDHISRLGQFTLPRGGFDVGSTRERIDQLIAMGLRVQIMEATSMEGGVARFPAISDDAELVATYLPLDLRGYDSVNVVIEKPDGTYLKTFRDVGWDPKDGSSYALCEAPLARISAKVGLIRSRIIGLRGGQEHVIADFGISMA